MDIANKINQFVTFIWCYAISVILIVTTGGAWLSDDSLSLTYDLLIKILSLILIGGFIIFLLFGNKSNITNDVKQKIFVIIACGITYKYASEVDTSYYSYCFLIILLWMIGCLALQKNRQCVWDAYVNVIIVIAVISLFFYLFGTIFHLVPETGTTSISWGTWDTSSVRTFFNLYYESQSMKISDTIRIMRNCGIFSEAPMYNFVLCVALNIELFLKQHSNQWKCAIIIVTILTTLSTTGILFLVLTGVLYFLEYAYQKGIIVAHKKLFGIVLIISLLAMFGVIWAKTFSPSGTGSMNVRTDHLLACIKTWIANPLHGCGYLNSEAVLSVAEYKQGLSVGLPYLLACGGIVLSLVLLFPYIVNIFGAIKNKNFKEVCFETLFLMLYFFTAITGQPLFLFFIAYITLYNYE